jgi:hypothetical protein
MRRILHHILPENPISLPQDIAQPIHMVVRHQFVFFGCMRLWFTFNEHNGSLHLINQIDGPPVVPQNEVFDDLQVLEDDVDHIRHTSEGVL